ncbi:hypothetical protein NBRC116583_34700 [Arenicella sp. 4NH20-0111]
MLVEDQNSHLFWSSSELRIWRERAGKGPYKTKGDVSPNSPGDWDHILKARNSFHKDALSDYFDPDKDLEYSSPKPENRDGCYNGKFPTNRHASRLRDTAFYGLIENDTASKRLALSALLRIARDRKMDFSNDIIWCKGKSGDGGVFLLSEWISRLVVAYDFLSNSIPADKRTILLRWFSSYANFARVDLNEGLEKLFEDRTAPTPVLSDYYLAGHEMRAPGYAGGPKIPRLSYFYNNRRANLARSIGIIGILNRDRRLVKDAQNFCREFLAYSVFKEGFIGEFERARADNPNTTKDETLPDLGWNYGIVAIGPCLTFAETLSRQGDDSLYQFSTSHGEFGTEGSPPDRDGKDLEFVAETMSNYVSDKYERYMYGHNNDPNFRIDARHPRNGSIWSSTADTAFAHANRFFKNHSITLGYRRKLLGTVPYPIKAVGSGGYYPFGGESSIFPGVLFMYDLPHDIKRRN